jgi:hypothetical protein
VADAVKSIMERGEKFGAVSDIVKKLRAFNVQIERWPEMLDAFSTSPDEYRAGAVDLGTAPAKVLAAIPGISEDAATEIEFRRERLDQEKRSTIAWPLLEGILTQEQFEKACDFLTARSMQWRVIIEGGVETAGAGNDSADSSPGGSAGLGASVQSERGSGAIFRDRIVLEAVIDVSSKRAHIAYLRDITHLRTAKQLASRAARPTPTDRRAGSEESAVPVANPKSSVTQPPTLNTLEMPGGLDFGGLDVGSMKGTELNSGTLDFGSAPGRADGPTPNPVDATSGAPPVDPQEEPPARDPRLGRWTTGRGGKP